jgi:hypothetical protein
MRHGRAKAARKTLRYFERTVNLKSKPYYSVLLDATFLTAMVRITTNTSTTAGSSSNNSNSNSNSQNQSRNSQDDIASRIERVLQVGGPSSQSMHSSSDDRTTMDHHNSRNHSDSNNHNNTNSPNTHNRYNVRYFIPQEAVDELEMIIQSLIEKSTQTKKKKKTEEYLLKASLFKNALNWINKNTISNKQKRAQQYNNGGNSTTNFSRCEILPKFDVDETQQQQQQNNNEGEEEEEEEENVEKEEGEETSIVNITATDAVRRHIALDDSRKERTYIVASQDDDLLYELRYKGTIPILRLANKATVLILENPSKSTKKNDIGKEKQKWFGRNILEDTEQALVDAAKKSNKKKINSTVLGSATKKRGGGPSGSARGGSGGDDPSGIKKQQRKKQHGPKEPNPLSCKRKRLSSDNGNNNASSSSSGKISSSKKRRERAKQHNNNNDNES